MQLVVLGHYARRAWVVALLALLAASPPGEETVARSAKRYLVVYEEYEVLRSGHPQAAPDVASEFSDALGNVLIDRVEFSRRGSDEAGCDEMHVKSDACDLIVLRSRIVSAEGPVPGNCVFSFTIKSDPDGLGSGENAAAEEQAHQSRHEYPPQTLTAQKGRKGLTQRLSCAHIRIGDIVTRVVVHDDKKHPS